MLWLYALVFLLAAVPLVESAVLTPIAIVAGLSWLPVILLAIAGNLLTVYLVIVFIEQIRSWRARKKGEKGEQTGKKTARAQRIWQRYGLPGMALIGPLIIGSHLTAFLSLIFGASKQSVTLWMTISIVGWSVLLGGLAMFGIDFLNMEDSYLERFFEQ